MCTLCYSGFGASGKRHILTVDILDGNVSIVYDEKKTLETIFDITEFSELSKDYNNNYATGVTYLDRKIFKEISSLLLAQEKFFELFRVFLRHTFLIFNYYNNDKNLLKHINSLYEAKKDNIFFDFLHIDWSGDMNVQPQFYFVEKGLNVKHLEKLYEQNMLNKLELTIGEKKDICYYVPFDIPNIPKSEILFEIATWLRISRKINEHVLRLTSGR